MQRFLLCAVFLVAVGTLLIDTGWVIAEEGSSKEKDDHAVVTKAIESLDAAIKYLENSPEDFGGQKAAVLEDSRKAAEQLRKIQKHTKKEGCRPGSLALMGVGC